MKRIIIKFLLFINSTLLIIYMGLEINIQMPCSISKIVSLFLSSLTIKFTQNHFTTGMDSHIVINQINDQCQRNGQYRRGV